MAWDNAAGLAAADRIQTGGRGHIANWADTIWDAICFLGAGDNDTFTREDIVRLVLDEAKALGRGLSPVTAANYVSAFMAYAKAAPDEFSGPKSRIVRVGRGVYRLDDNPER